MPNHPRNLENKNSGIGLLSPPTEIKAGSIFTHRDSSCVILELKHHADYCTAFAEIVFFFFFPDCYCSILLQSKRYTSRPSVGLATKLVNLAHQITETPAPRGPHTRASALLIRPLSHTSAHRAMLSKHVARSAETAVSPFLPPPAPPPDCSSSARAIQGPLSVSYTAPQAPPSARASSSAGMLPSINSAPAAGAPLLRGATPTLSAPALAIAKSTTRTDVRSARSGESLPVMDLCHGKRCK